MAHTPGAELLNTGPVSTVVTNAMITSIVKLRRKNSEVVPDRASRRCPR
jgi:hypothetical protein